MAPPSPSRVWANENARLASLKAMQRHLIVTADDFGLHVAVNEAVERASREGILTAASLMVSGPAAADVEQDIAVPAAPNVQRRYGLLHPRTEQSSEFIGMPVRVHRRCNGRARRGGRMQVNLSDATR